MLPPKYSYPYVRCSVCNHRLKPKYLKSNCNVYFKYEYNKWCCIKSLIIKYGVIQAVKLTYLEAYLRNRSGIFKI